MSDTQDQTLTATATKDETPAAPVQQDTAAFVSPNEDTSKETTPIGDEAKAAAKEYLKEFDAADVSRRREDDNPLNFAGDFVDEEND